MLEMLQKMDVECSHLWGFVDLEKANEVLIVIDTGVLDAVAADSAIEEHLKKQIMITADLLGYDAIGYMKIVEQNGISGIDLDRLLKILVDEYHIIK